MSTRRCLPLYCHLLLAVSCGIAFPTDVLAADDDPTCTTLFSTDDPRLFDFVGTRKAIDFNTWAGQRIGNIEYVTLPVFNTHDPEEDRLLYRGANRIHLLTREATLRKQVLLREGDTLDDSRVRESERILRGNGYLYDAMILPARQCAGSIDLLVVSRDIWTLQPSANISRKGGQTNSSFGFSEENFLGNGQMLAVSMESTAARNSTVFAFEDQHLFDGHSILELSHTDSSDGRGNSVRLERPFYAFDTRHSGGISFSDETLTETTTAAGVATSIYDHREQSAETFFGWSDGLQGDTAERWRVGMTRQEDRYRNQQLPGATQPMPADRRLVYGWLEFEHNENHFVTMSNVSRMFRNEDIDIGTVWRLRGGMTSHWLGSVQDGWLAQFEWHDTLGFGSHHLLRNTLRADAFMYDTNDEQRDSLYGYELRYDYFIDERNRWLANLKLDFGVNLAPEDELVTGGANGLLGYPDAWQRGDRRAVAALERRHFLNVHPLHLFRIATAAFIEAGQARDSTGTVNQTDAVLVDVGVGLRLNSSKARSNNILQFNLAMPLVDGTAAGGLQWSIFAGEAF